MQQSFDLVFCPQSGESLAFFSSFRQLIHVPTVERKMNESPAIYPDFTALPIVSFEYLENLSKQMGYFFTNEH